ncbi:S-adenosylmethionine:tRNA ribosyltransferase-isomerase [Candidatus Gracilibacteria bacterium]|nr:S-adenosylmethionine:tRNA ribosyltransferase-isomerase [Candidatus Gracilibacteria bacterium]
MFSLSDYRYHLDESLIAQEAIHPHHDARMMVINKEKGTIEAETTFWELDQYIGSDRVIFFNDSKVLPSRVILLDTPFLKKDDTSGLIKDGEIFYLSKITENTFSALVRPGNKFQIGNTFHIGEFIIHVIENTDNGRILEITGGSTEEFLDKYGSLPLPPYIKYSKEKEADYQTSFAKNTGSVAAPTASLHFTRELLEKLTIQKEYLTLHVGLGTFKGIQTADVRDYVIHAESIEIDIGIFGKIQDIKESHKKIVAVGTTATRTLESLPYLWKNLPQDIKNLFNANICKYWDNIALNLKNNKWINDVTYHEDTNSLHFNTQIYITPGFQFIIIDDLITNFHLGESSLLVLVSAFLGFHETKEIYKHAVDSRYRFYSFGDGMYIRGK